MNAEYARRIYRYRTEPGRVYAVDGGALGVRELPENLVCILNHVL